MRTARIEAMPPLNCQDCQFCGAAIIEAGRARDYFICLKMGCQVNADEAEVCRFFEPTL